MVMLILTGRDYEQVANVEDGDSDEADGAADFVMSFGFTPTDKVRLAAPSRDVLCIATLISVRRHKMTPF